MQRYTIYIRCMTLDKVCAEKPNYRVMSLHRTINCVHYGQEHI